MTETFCASLPRRPDCGSTARHLLQERFGDQLEPTALGDVQMVISELVNNAYLHGTGAIELKIELVDGRLRVEVVDEGQGAAIQVSQHGTARGGHGLRIVQALSSAWGAFEGTTHVWAELDVAREDPAQLPI